MDPMITLHTLTRMHPYVSDNEYYVNLVVVDSKGVIGIVTVSGDAIVLVRRQTVRQFPAQIDRPGHPGGTAPYSYAPHGPIFQQIF